jgi:hypothetical protein
MSTTKEKAGNECSICERKQQVKKLKATLGEDLYHTSLLTGQRIPWSDEELQSWMPRCAHTTGITSDDFQKLRAECLAGRGPITAEQWGQMEVDILRCFLRHKKGVVTMDSAAAAPLHMLAIALYFGRARRAPRIVVQMIADRAAKMGSGMM